MPSTEPAAVYMRELWKKSPTHRERVKRYQAEWRKNNREYDNFRLNLNRYGLTLDQYHAKLESQNFLCAMCREDEPRVIDHNHTTGKVRGLLCWNCNSGFGQFRESPVRLRAAIDYASRWI